MRKRTVKFGLNLVLAGVVSITLGTFYYNQISGILSLSAEKEALLIIMAIFLGTVFCGIGIVTSFVGALREPANGKTVRLSYTIVLLISALIVFFFLFFMSTTDREKPGLEPGETITI